jgi:hypothetical protein
MARLHRPIDGVEMKLLAILALTCALCPTAIAQTPECRSISDPGARLACYDGATPPAASKPPLRAPPVSIVDGAKYVDSISAEDALVN